MSSHVTLRKNIQELKNFKKSQIGCSAEKYIATILVDTYYIIRRDEEKIPEKAIDFCNNHIKPKLEKIGFLDE